jgi:hypothetical protein
MLNLDQLFGAVGSPMQACQPEEVRGMRSMLTETRGQTDVRSLVHHLHSLMVYGPGDLEIAHALSPYGYDAVKWAEGQGMLAELVTCDTPGEGCLDAAQAWYQETASTARRALGAHPRLLAKLGLREMCPG